MSWSFFFGGGGAGDGCGDLWFFIGHLHLSAQFWSVLAHTHYLTFNTLLLSLVVLLLVLLLILLAHLTTTKVKLSIKLGNLPPASFSNTKSSQNYIVF